MDNMEYVAETPVEEVPATNKKNGIKFIVLGIVAIALVIIVALIVSNFMSGNNEEPDNLFYENLVCVYDADDEQWGYANKSGKMVIKAKYAEAYNFAECGLALVCDDEGMYGFIDANGKIVIKAKYAAASSFNQFDVAVVVDDEEGLYGVINKKGESVIKPKYAYIGEFNDYGTAPFMDEEGLWGFIDYKGKLVVKAKFYDVENFNEKGVSVAMDENDEWGVINKKGEWILKPKFDSVSGFDQFNRCIVEVDGEYGIIDQNGKYIVKPKYGRISEFSDDGLAIFYSEEDEAYGALNTKGKEVIEADFDYIAPFKDGIALAQDGRDIVIINKSGKEIAEFDDCEPGALEFSENGLIAVLEETKKGNAKYGYANKKGEIIIEFDYSDAEAFAKCGLALVSDGKSYGYINKAGEFVIQPDYEDATSFFDDGFAVVYEEDDDGVETAIIINKKGKTIGEFDAIKFGFDTKIHGAGSVEDVEDWLDDMLGGSGSGSGNTEVGTGSSNEIPGAQG